MKLLRAQSGFTLLEVLIAFALIVVIVFATVMTSSQGLFFATQNRNLVLATNLARNLINEKEVAYEGRSFEQLQEKEEGAFEGQKDWKWKIEISKVDFSALTDLIAREQAEQDKGASGEDQQQGAIVMKTFKDYLEKSVRRMKVTIEWPEGNGTSQQEFSQLLVNYDQELNTGF